MSFVGDRWSVNARYKDGASTASTFANLDRALVYVRQRLSDSFIDKVTCRSDMKEILIHDHQVENAIRQIRQHMDVFRAVYEDGRWWIFAGPEASPLFEPNKRYHHHSFYFELLAMSLAGAQ